MKTNFGSLFSFKGGSSETRSKTTFSSDSAAGCVTGVLQCPSFYADDFDDDPSTKDLPPTNNASRSQKSRPVIPSASKGTRSSRKSSTRKLPGIFALIERREWKLVSERAKKYPQECKVWGSVNKSRGASRRRHYSQQGSSVSFHSSGKFLSDQSYASMDTSASTRTAHINNQSRAGVPADPLKPYVSRDKVNTVECKALHHACQRLRSVHNDIQRLIDDYVATHGHIPEHIEDNNLSSEDYDDPWTDACKAILALIEAHPKAASQRESRHGCLPIHLAVFAMRQTPTLENPAPSPSSLASCSPDGKSRSRDTSTQFNFSDNVIGIHSPSNQPPPPRSLRTTRRLSKSSSSSSRSNHSDVSDMMRGKGTDAIASSHSVDVDEVLEMMEEELRRKNQNRSAGDGAPQAASTISTTEEAELIEAARVFSTERPPPLTSRSVSGGSISSSGSSLTMTSGATIPSIVSDVGGSGEQQTESFNLGRYLANATRRDEYSLRVVSALLDAYPAAARVDSEGGRLPLHTAITGRATALVIQAILRAYGTAARLRDKDGYLPLHLAAYWGVSDPAIVPALLRAYPDGVIGRNKWERSPSEEAMLVAGENGREYQTDILRALCRPSAYWYGLVPDNAWKEDVELFIMGERNIGISRPVSADEDGGPGIFSGEGTTKKYNIITLLKDRRWDHAVHHVLQKQSRACRWLDAPCRAGFLSKITPLHLASELNPTNEIIQTLLKACPQAILKRKNPGMHLPLHCACNWDASPDVIDLLVASDKSKTSLETPDHLGNVPLHSACFSGANERTVEILLSIFPEAVGVRNDAQDKPIDIVKRLRHPNWQAVIDLIESTTMELAKNEHRKGDRAAGKKLNQRGNEAKPKKSLDTSHKIKDESLEEDDDGLLWV